MKRFILRFFGWTALIDIPLFFAGIALLLAFNAYLQRNPKEPYFELFLTKIFYTKFDSPFYYPINTPTPDEKLNIEWIVNENDLRSFNSPRMSIINHGEPFYANTRDIENNFWIHACYITYRESKIDTIWDGMGCGTGMFCQLVEQGEKLNYTWYPSLFDKINTPDNYPRTQHITSSNAIEQIFGDSTQIYWTLSTFSVPWSNYIPQIVQSPSFMLYTDDLKTTWNEQIKRRKSSPMFLLNNNANLEQRASNMQKTATLPR